MRRLSFFHRIAAPAVVVAWILGCGDPGGPGEQASMSFNAQLPPDVRAVVIQVSGPGIARPLVFDFVPDSAGGTQGTIAVPAGAGRDIAGAAFEAGGVEAYAGDTTVLLRPGTNPALRLVLRPLNGNQPIIVTLGSDSVIITPGDTALVAGDTARYSATVLDEGGNLEPAAVVSWASTNPTVAAVDSTGLVRTSAAGTATIVAQFGASAATVAVTVTGPAPTSWSLDPTAPAGAFLDVWGASDSSVWLAGPGPGRFTHWDGASWTVTFAGSGSGLVRSISGSSDHAIYATQIDTLDGSSFIMRYNGSVWEGVFGASTSLPALWASAQDTVWAVGDNGVVFRGGRAGDSWVQVGSGPGAALEGAWGTSASLVFAVGQSGIAERCDPATCAVLPTGVSATLYDVWGTSASDVFAVGDGGIILHYDGNNWISTPSGTTATLRAVFGTRSDNVIAVGAQGTILRFDGSRWHRMSSGTTADLRGIWASSATRFIVAGASGVVLRSR
ncbi:MAG TPA: Ig-like domain-containing protein [Gemmatimonadales bacterium]|nr:Ig-like domain-containing protein [Gemmatimonadales bacterium]